MSAVFKAGGTIRVARFVKLTGDNQVEECDANEKAIGISDIGGRTPPIPDVTTDPPEAAQSGEQVAVHVPFWRTGADDVQLTIGSGGCSAGTELKSDADGKGVAVASSAGQWVGAIAVRSASEDEIVPVLQCLYETGA